MNDFDRVFDPAYSAVDLFTDRRAEHEVFECSLARHADEVLAGQSTLARASRRNVLTFYGIGGIGKTELSRRLERWVTGNLASPGEWGEPARFDQEIRTVRVDFHGSSAVDAADIVMRLRAAVAGSARPLAAFDLGFAAWWALAHPGTYLPEMRSPLGADVRAQITDTLNDILTDAGARFGVGPLTVRMGIRLVDAIRSHRLRGATLRECAPLTTVIEEAHLNPSPYVAATLAGLLSWDLERLHPAQMPLVIAFADAVEYVQGGDRSQERLFNRIVNLTPQVLWVITSRTSLDWDSTDLTGTLPASGPHVWPGLRLDAADEPRQHLVGDLSEADVRRFLRAASENAGIPALSGEVIERIQEGAHGLPLYLDLSLALARETARAEGTLDPATFGGPLPELVNSVFADLPAVERDVARAASLLPRFDPSLVAEATGGRLGDALRFSQRSMVTRDDHPLFQFRVHDAVRSAIAQEPITNTGAWAPADRKSYAERLVQVMRIRHDEFLDVDHRREILELVAGLCAAHDLRPPWLAKSLTDLPGFTLTVSRLPPPSEVTWIGQLSGFFHAWDNRTPSERIAYLTDFVAVRRDHDIDMLARRWLAFSLRSRQKYAHQALAILQDLLSKEPDSELLRYQVARTLRQLGWYEELEEHLERYPLGVPSAAIRIRSDLAYDRGDMVEALAGARARASYLRSVTKYRIALENEGAALWRAALTCGASVADCDRVINEADRYGLRSVMRTAFAAKIVCLNGDEITVDDCVAETTRIITASDSKKGWREWSATAIHALYTGDLKSVDEIRAQWDGSRIWSPGRQFVDRLFIFAGYPPTYPPRNIGGVDHSAIDQRWHAVIKTLIEHVRG